MSIKLEPSWKALLNEEFTQVYFQELTQQVRQAYQSHTCYPPGSLIFNALDTTPVEKVKVVLLGQDPYHNPGQAHGLSFSVQPPQPLPPSLRNILKEIAEDTGKPSACANGSLHYWAEQGVLLLNSILSVQAQQPGSHQHFGWTTFTDRIISLLSQKKEHIVFLLWGSFAQNKAPLISKNNHLILKAAHPSPFSAHKGFFGCRHFSQTNAYLLQHQKEPINW